MPEGVVIPELAYVDVREAVVWLSEKFGFAERLRIGTHRAQRVVGSGGAIVITQRGPLVAASETARLHTLMVRLSEVDRPYAVAVQAGVKILRPPADYPYGERQYSAEDIGGHVWTFSQTIADVDPANWGGVLVAARSAES